MLLEFGLPAAFTIHAVQIVAVQIFGNPEAVAQLVP